MLNNDKQTVKNYNELKINEIKTPFFGNSYDAFGNCPL